MLHRIGPDQIEAMPGPRFFAYCYRLTAYQGVIAAAHRRQQVRREQRATAGPISLSEWMRNNQDAVQAAHQRMSGRG